MGIDDLRRKLGSRGRSTIGHSIIEYGSGGGPRHWGQTACERCGAWMTDMPQRAQAEPFTEDVADPMCPTCGGEGSCGGDGSPYSPGVACTCLHPERRTRYRFEWDCLRCGQRREAVSASQPSEYAADGGTRILEPGSFPPDEKWLLDRRLIDLVNRTGLSMLGGPPDGATVVGCTSLLDHEGVRSTSWGVYRGDTEDPTGLRLLLAALRNDPRILPEAHPIVAHIEHAVLGSASVYALLPDLLYFADEVLCGDELDDAVEVAPVIGAGRLALLRRYSSWPALEGPEVSEWARQLPSQQPQEYCSILKRIDIVGSIHRAFGTLMTADTQSDREGDLKLLGDVFDQWRADIGLTTSQRRANPRPRD
jgi:hypothetical protein